MTILSFSLERYLAICTPLYIFPMSDIRRACLVSALCWATALLASVPHLLFSKINYIEDPESSHRVITQSAFCAMMDDNIYPEVTWPSHTVCTLTRHYIPVVSRPPTIVCHILPTACQSAHIFLLQHDHRDQEGRQQPRQEVHCQAAGQPKPGLCQ